MKWKRRYYSLIDKVYPMSNLMEAWKEVKKNRGSPGVDGLTVEWFESQLRTNLQEIQRFLKQGRYQPDPVLRTYIQKDNGKWRPLGIPTIRDRITQQAVRRVIEPLFEQDFYEHSYGFRKARSAHQALDVVQQARRAGYEYVVDLDIQSFFDEIPHHLLMDKVRERVVDGKILNVIEDWLTSGIMEDDRFYETEIGSPQGGVISPLLANIYLNTFDWEMKRKGYPIVRYADDAIVFCRTKAQANRAYEAARYILEEQLQLRMHPIKTNVVHFDDGFRFLGFDFWKTFRVLPEEKVKKHKDSVRRITKRQQGKNLLQMIERLNQVVRGFGNYYYIGNVKRRFKDLDSWTRMRVRAFWRKKKSALSNRRIPNHLLERAGMVFLMHLLTTCS